MAFGLVLVILIAVLAALLLLYALLIEPGQIRVRRYTLTLERDTSALLAVVKASAEPPARSINHVGTVLVISDLHASPYYGRRRLRRLKRRLLAERPAAVLFAGDLIAEVSRLKSPAFHTRLVAFWRALSDVCPVFAVLGNHDAEAVATRSFVTAVYEASGVTLLINAYADVALGDDMSLAIYGADERYHGTPRRVADTFSGLVIEHEPDVAPDLVNETHRSLVVSGHVHRGQVAWFGRPLLTPRLGRHHTYGHYTLDANNALVVTSGLGTVHLPLRFTAWPEIIAFEIAATGGIRRDTDKASGTSSRRAVSQKRAQPFDPQS